MKEESMKSLQSRKEFISDMMWLASEIHASDKGNALDLMKLLEFHLASREAKLEQTFTGRLQMYIYENVDGNKQKLLNQTLDIYANQKK